MQCIASASYVSLMHSLQSMLLPFYLSEGAKDLQFGNVHNNYKITHFLLFATNA